MRNRMVDRIQRELLEVLAPSRCYWCRRLVGAGRGGCPACSDALPWHEHACRACSAPIAAGRDASICTSCLEDAPPQDRSWAAFRYEAPIAQAIIDLKFHGRLTPAHILGRLMGERLARRAEPLPELLIPVPLATARLRQRGYNQALQLGRALSGRLALRLVPAAARRTRETGEQTRLDAAARRRNVRDAFAVDAAIVRGRHVALLDDVVTTGATMAELARAARAAGAARVEGWAVARVL
jgi:ComF family protein